MQKRIDQVVNYSVLRFDTRFGDERAHFHDLGFAEIGEFVGRAAQRIGADTDQFRAHVGHAHDFRNLASQRRNNGARSTGWRR